MPHLPIDFRPPPTQPANSPAKAPRSPAAAVRPLEAIPAEPELTIDPGDDLPPYTESVQVTPKPRKRGTPKPKVPVEEAPQRLGMRRTSIKDWKVDPAIIAKQLYS